MNNRIFEDKLKERLLEPARQQQTHPSYGIVLSYNSLTNTASVLMANPGSDDMGEIFNNVPCPTSIGVQGVAPEAGRPCWVIFKDGSLAFPVITHFFNHAYNQIDHTRQTNASSQLPRFMLNM